MLEYGHRCGRVRLRGPFAIEEAGDPPLLRMLAPRSVEVLQQRRYVRIRAARPVVVYGAASAEGSRASQSTSAAAVSCSPGSGRVAVGEEITFPSR